MVLYINEKGTIDKIKDVGSTCSTLPVKENAGTFPGEERIKLDNALASSMSNLKFIPAVENGQPVKSSLFYRRAIEILPDGNIKVMHVQFISNTPGDFIQVDNMPKIKTTSMPVYPEQARQSGLEGTVYLKVLVDQSGMPVKTEIIKSTNDIFNQPAIDAAMKFTFTPAIKDNKPVAVWVVIPFKYKLGGLEGQQKRHNELPKMRQKK